MVGITLGNHITQIGKKTRLTLDVSIALLFSRGKLLGHRQTLLLYPGLGPAVTSYRRSLQAEK